jgi:hypothetical protein
MLLLVENSQHVSAAGVNCRRRFFLEITEIEVGKTYINLKRYYKRQLSNLVF